MILGLQIPPTMPRAAKNKPSSTKGTRKTAQPTKASRPAAKSSRPAPAPVSAPAAAPDASRPHPDAPAVALRSLIQRHLVSTLARHAGSATPRDWWVATALAVRDTIHVRMIATQTVHNAQNVRRLYYFSLEYLMGRLFGNNLLATGLLDEAKEALTSLGQDFETIRESEVDMGLGNGGLGRLAACFLDSLATMDYPAPFPPSSQSMTWRITCTMHAGASSTAPSTWCTPMPASWPTVRCIFRERSTRISNGIFPVR